MRNNPKRGLPSESYTKADFVMKKDAPFYADLTKRNPQCTWGVTSVMRFWVGEVFPRSRHTC